MTSLTLLAPVVVDLHAIPGASLAAPERYAEFWRAAEAEAQTHVVAGTLAGQGSVVVPHIGTRAGVNLYRSLQGYSGETDPHLFSGTVPSTFFAAALAGHAAWARGLGPVHFKAYDHGIVLVEATADISTLLAESEDPVAVLDALEVEASLVGEAVARMLVLDVVQPFVARLQDLPGARDVLDFSDGPADGIDDIGSPMWVTRTLTLQRNEPATPALVRRWLRDSTDPSAPDCHHDLVTGAVNHHVRWVNYVFLDDAGRARPVEIEPDVWAGLEFSQYFYGALDRVDSLLSEVLARSSDTSYRGDLPAMRQSLRTLSQRAELIIMDKQRVSKYLNRRVRAHLDDIMEGWHYAAVLEEPVSFKIDLCTRRLDDLKARRQVRSALVTDIILLLIGVTSILATALSLSDFGRSMATDVEMGPFDLGSSRLTAWFAGLPADTLLLSSGLLSLLLIVSYAAFRGDADS